MQWTIDVALKAKPDDLVRALRRTSDATRDLDRMQQRLDRVDRQLGQMAKGTKLRVDDQDLDAANQKAAKLAGAKPKINVLADDSALKSAAKTADSLGGRTETVRVTADDGDLDAAVKKAFSLDENVSTVLVTADDGSIDAAKRKIDALDAETVNVRVNVDTSDVKSLDSLDVGDGGAGGLSSAVGGLVGQLGSVAPAATAAGAGLAVLGANAAATKITVDQVRESVMLAGDAAETLSASRQIFRGETDNFLAGFANAPALLGETEAAAISLGNGFGGMFTNLGFARDEAATMAQDMVARAADVGSLLNGQTAEVAEAFQAAMRGEFEQVEKYNIFLNANSVAQRAVAEGYAKSTTEVSAHARARATMLMITEQSAVADGDFQRTLATSLPNALKQATSSVQQARTEFGEPFLQPAIDGVNRFTHEVLPALEPTLDSVSGQLADTFSDTADALLDLAADSGPLIESFADFAEHGLAAVGVLAKLAQGVSKLDGFVQDVTGGLSLMDANLAVVTGGLSLLPEMWSKAFPPSAAEQVKKLETDLDRAFAGRVPELEELSDAQRRYAADLEESGVSSGNAAKAAAIYSDASLQAYYATKDQGGALDEVSRKNYDATVAAGKAADASQAYAEDLGSLSNAQREYHDVLVEAGIASTEAIALAQKMNDADAERITALQGVRNQLDGWAQGQANASAQMTIFRGVIADGSISLDEMSAAAQMTGLSGEELGQYFTAAADQMQGAISKMAGELPTAADAISSLQMTADNFDAQNVIDEMLSLIEANIEVTQNMTDLASRGFDDLVRTAGTVPEEYRGLFLKQLLELPPEELAAQEARIEEAMGRAGTVAGQSVKAGIPFDTFSPIFEQMAGVETGLAGLSQVQAAPTIIIVDEASGQLREIMAELGALPAQKDVLINIREQRGFITAADFAGGAAAFHAEGGIHTFASGGLLDRGGVTSSPVVVFGEPRTGQEAFIPRDGISPSRAEPLIRTAAAWHGIPMGGGQTQVNLSFPINVTGGQVSAADVRREVSRAMSGGELDRELAAAQRRTAS